MLFRPVSRVWHPYCTISAPNDTPPTSHPRRASRSIVRFIFRPYRHALNVWVSPLATCALPKGVCYLLTYLLHLPR